MSTRIQPSRSGALLIAAFAVAAISGCGGDDDGPTIPPAAALEDTIRIVVNATQKMSMAFTPNPDTVVAGTTVRWINLDTPAHTITSDPGAPESFNIMIAGGGQQVRKFSNAGSFPYHCSVFGHNMNATLVVLP